MGINKKPAGLEGYIITLLAIFFMIMLAFAVYLLVAYHTSLAEQTEDMALTASIDFISEINSRVGAALRQTEEIAAVAGTMTSETEILRYFNAVSQSTNTPITFIRFFNRGREYDSSGQELETKEPESIMRLVNINKAGCAGLIYDHNSYTSMSFIAFYAPVSGNDLIDGVVSYCMVTQLFDNMVSFRTDSAQKSAYLGLCTVDGTIILEVRSDSFPSKGLTNIYRSIREVTNDRAVVDQLAMIVTNEGVGSCSFRIGGETYALAVACSAASDNTLYIANIYKASELHGAGYEFVANISVALIILLLIVAAGITYLVLLHLRDLEQIKSYDTTNPLLKCNTYKKFCLDAEAILEKNKITKFALVYTEIEQFRFITEKYENINADEVLRFLAKVFGMSLLQEETFGHISDDKFVLLLHYSDEKDLMNRLRVIWAEAFNYPELKKHKYNLKLSMGVYCINRAEKEPVQKMLDRAVIAQKSNIHTTTEQINIYDERVKSRFMREAEIEARQEAALTDNEFKIFYQPKYNIQQNRPDGAEALLRWYDSETNTFRNPEEFVPIFEASGFIAKIDKYVYVEVCKYLSEAVQRGLKVVPVSVNVSRVTATQEGFVDFYVRTKRKYIIADNFLTLEFTESIAYENYDLFKDIVRKLKANGIRCSIDDFGSGYSSYNILKELEMDELKLDRFFITKGFSQERDDELLKTIIRLAKSFGMKVVQEGVETLDALERLEKFGCDVIQGYFYSKPLTLHDYIDFLNRGGALQRY
ncbi:MAG: EAL domain-containing protein [Eubacteriales bacterium]|jgi:EAL domain-containing protein (putative c-di-GMP-specific phosphodiesterase class I)/GGDEF domain-containing protein